MRTRGKFSVPKSWMQDFIPLCVPALLDVNVVIHDYDVRGIDLEKAARFNKALSGKVHVGHRLDDYNVLACDLTLAVHALELVFIQGNAVFFAQHIDSKVTHVVPRVHILSARISEPCDYPHIRILNVCRRV